MSLQLALPMSPIHTPREKIPHSSFVPRAPATTRRSNARGVRDFIARKIKSRTARQCRCIRFSCFAKGGAAGWLGQAKNG